MEKSGIIANLEGILEPVPESGRLLLKRKKSIDKYLKRSASPDYAKEENERMYAYNLTMYRCIGELLSQAENMRAFMEAKDYIEAAAKEIPESSMELNINPGALAAQFLEMKGIVDEMAGVNAESPSICFVNTRGSKYSIPEQKATIRINLFLLNACAHEYAHHLTTCSKAQIKWITNIPNEEGFASGMGRNGANVYASAHKMPFLKKISLEHEARIMEKAESMLKNKPLFPDKQDFGIYGAAAFLVAEAKHGKIIYREIIRSANPAEYLIKKLS